MNYNTFNSNITNNNENEETELKDFIERFKERASVSLFAIISSTKKSMINIVYAVNKFK